MAYKITSTLGFPDDAKFWQDWFTLDVNRSSAWILSARDLLEHIRAIADTLRKEWIEYHCNGSSDQLAPPRGQHRVYLFLSALVMENLLKAVVVHQARWPDSQIAQKIPSELNSHDLLDLAAAGQVELTDDEVEILERLTQFGIWLGRYPAPTKLQDMKPKKLKSGIVNLAGYMHGSDIREVESFINKLLDKLKEAEGIEHLARFPIRTPEDFEGYSVSPNIRPW